jgi:SAM-dependent methyltransferase
MVARVKSLPASLIGPDMRKRLGAWWRGEPSQGDGAEQPPVEPNDERAPADWLVVAEQLWGAGALGPGEDGFIAELKQRLNLGAEAALAYFGIGLGGAARHFVEQSEISIKGYEPDPDAAALGIEQCRRAGRGKKVAISHVTFDFLKLPKERFDAIAGKDAFHDVADKTRVFKQIARALKSGASLFFTDYIVTGDPLDAGTCTTLFGKRSMPVSPCSAETYLGLMTSHGFDVVANEDLTDFYIARVTEGWSNLRALLDHLGAQADNPVRRMHFLRAVADEAAMWANRLEALRARRLEVRRFIGQKPA